MRGDEEREECTGILIHTPPEQPRKHHAMAEARYGKQLGHPLEEPEGNRLGDGDHAAKLTVG